MEPLFMSFYINTDRTHIYNSVVNSLKTAGLQMLEKNTNANIIFTSYINSNDILLLNEFQKINHFPVSINLGNKDYLWKNCNRMIQKYPLEYSGVQPESWVLPAQYDEFMQVKEENSSKFFIIKPVNSSCGKGIRIIDGKESIASLKSDKSYIISTYIDQPLLIKNKKFDMRMYVVVTSFHPLRAYLHDEGLARFATEDYSNDPDSLENMFVHLTNFSINKKNVGNYVKN